MFHLTCIGWMLFRSPSIQSTLIVIRQFWSDPLGITQNTVPLSCFLIFFSAFPAFFHSFQFLSGRDQEPPLDSDWEEQLYMGSCSSCWLDSVLGETRASSTFSFKGITELEQRISPKHAGSLLHDCIAAVCYTGAPSWRHRSQISNNKSLFYSIEHKLVAKCPFFSLGDFESQQRSTRLSTARRASRSISSHASD